MKKFLISTCAIVLTSFPGIQAFAQTYLPIDSELGIYCGDFPDGNTMIVGLKNDVVSTLVPDSEIAELRKRISVNRKRANTLTRLRKRKVVAANIKTFKKIYLGVNEKRFRGGPQKAVRALSKLIRAINKQNRRFSDIITDIQNCEKGELPAPTGGTLGVIEFEFIHPDFGVTYYMRGIGLKYSGNPRKFGSVCVSFESTQGTNYSRLPKESRVTPLSNPCIVFYQSIFREIPNCSGVNVDGNPRTLVQWVDDVGVTTRPLSESERTQLEKKVARFGLVTSRAYKKKKGCRS